MAAGLVLAVAALLISAVSGQAPAPAAPCVVSATANGAADCELVVAGVLTDAACQSLADGVGVATMQPGTTYFQNTSASVCTINTLVQCDLITTALPLQDCPASLSTTAEADLAAGDVDEKAPDLAPQPGKFVPSAPLDLCYVDAATSGAATCVVLTMDLSSQTACTDVGQLLTGLLPSSSSLGVKLFFDESVTTCLAAAPGTCASLIGSGIADLQQCNSTVAAVVNAEAASLYAAGAPAVSGAPALAV